MGIAGSSPFFSIAVATYRRPELLRQNLLSILELNSDFPDFEIVIGNNDPSQTLSLDSLGIDPRHYSKVRLLNNARPMTQLENMNNLLENSRGTYFTWLNDDDLYSRGLLSAVAAAARSAPDVESIFTGYTSFKGDQRPGEAEQPQDPSALSWAGSDFVCRYFHNEAVTIGCYGFFRREALRRRGGMPDLGAGRPLYSDNLMALEAGLAPRVLFLPGTKIFYRWHESSFSASVSDKKLLIDLQVRYFQRALTTLRQLQLKEPLPDFLLILFRTFLSEFLVFAARAGRFGADDRRDYARVTSMIFPELRGSSAYWKARVLCFLAPLAYLKIRLRLRAKALLRRRS